MNWKKWRDVLKGFLGRGTCPYQFSFILSSFLRRFILTPETLAERLHLDKTSRVLELGPGPGYFSVEIASRLPQGHLVLFDIQAEMLQKARRKLQAAGHSNTAYMQGSAEALPCPADTFDIAFLIAVLGEVPDAGRCLQSLYRVMCPGGLLSITEQPGDPDFQPLATVRALAEGYGFEWVKSFGQGKNYTANFRKPRG